MGSVYFRIALINNILVKSSMFLCVLFQLSQKFQVSLWTWHCTSVALLEATFLSNLLFSEVPSSCRVIYVRNLRKCLLVFYSSFDNVKISWLVQMGSFVNEILSQSALLLRIIVSTSRSASQIFALKMTKSVTSLQMPSNAPKCM